MGYSIIMVEFYYMYNVNWLITMSNYIDSLHPMSLSSEVIASNSSKLATSNTWLGLPCGIQQ